MKRFAAFAMTLGLILGAQSALQAGPLDWSYEWTVSPIAVGAASGGGNISLSNNNGAASVTGNSGTVATTLASNSFADAGTPDVFNSSNTYTLTMTLTDTTSTLSDTFEFTGYFDGTLWHNGILMTNHFTTPTTLAKQIGDNIYTVTLDTFVPPPHPNASGLGSIGGHVTVERTQVEPPNDVPEPSALLLSGLGLSLMGLVYRRKKA